MVLKWDLFGLKTASNQFQKYYGNFLRDLVFTKSRVDQDLWICKSKNDEGYYYIATHVDDFIISANNSSKYMHGIEMLYGTYGTYRPVYECTHIFSVMGKAYHMVHMGWICLDVDIHIFSLQ